MVLQSIYLLALFDANKIAISPMLLANSIVF